MPRKTSIQQNQFPYHITGRCINKEWFNLPLDTVWKVFCEELHIAHILYDLRIHSFVLMSNHYHLIARTPDSNISKCMHRFSLNSSLRLTRMGNRINETFTGRHFKTILHEPNYYLNCYKYVYRNPVEAGLSNNVQSYPFSTLNAKLGQNRLLLPVENDDTLFPDSASSIKWLNTTPDKEKLNAIRYGLKRTYFQSPKTRTCRRHVLKPNEVI